MKKKQLNLLASILLILILTSCGSLENHPTSQPIPDNGQENTEGETIIITPAIRGNSAVIKIGDILKIKIPTIPTEGFEWRVKDLDKNILKQEGGAVYTENTDPDSAGGIVTLSFKAVGKGLTDLNLEYASLESAEGLSLSKNTFGMTVEVK